MKTVFLFILTVAFLLSCKKEKKEIAETWNVPYVIDTLPISDRYYETKRIGVPLNEHIYFGTRKDSISVDTNYRNLYPFHEELTNPSDTLKSTNGIEIIPDLSQELSTWQGGYLAQSKSISKNEINADIDSDSSNWKNLNYVKSYPVFVRNTTRDSIFIDNQDGRLFLIQEAKNKKGEWQSIEYWSYATCGNSYAKTGIGPDDILVIKKIQYAGVFQTQMRLKLRTNSQIVYSKPYDGSIHIEQFSLDSLGSRAKKRIGDKDYINSILLYK